MLNRLMITLSEKSHAKGIAYAILSYVMWGILPIFWKALKQINAAEILASRIVWSFAFLLLILVIIGGLGDLKQVFSNAKTILGVFFGSLLISANWFIYIWAVNNDHVIEASLGYYINPLFTVVLGIVVLKEQIDKWQIVSLLLALFGVVVITIQYGKIPWVALSGVVTAIPLLLFAQGAKCVPLSTMGFIQYLSPSITLLMGVFLFKEVFTRVDLISFALIWLALGIYSFSRKDFLNSMVKKGLYRYT